jgi:hypothetical protein
MLYSLLYINIDQADYAEILGVYSTKEQAVLQLLERANYRERGGILTQYMEHTDEYESFDVLKNKVMDSMELVDVDIYRISEHYLDDKNVDKSLKRNKPN